jgi:hypothetical protein
MSILEEKMPKINKKKKNVVFSPFGFKKVLPHVYTYSLIESF